ncbi:probable serine/threonine-protein kinase mps1 [Drosophila nasuta]|uniref:probable serine/threonine-protein kinase mps1 n=1 Tax=Drosophila nasuta TaxID=42062 RepID=UPI00295E5C06|nr:probable serine/threonine-protein kinase mps1 [Drosophila nasuta]
MSCTKQRPLCAEEAHSSTTLQGGSQETVSTIIKQSPTSPQQQRLSGIAGLQVDEVLYAQVQPENNYQLQQQQQQQQQQLQQQSRLSTHLLLQQQQQQQQQQQATQRQHQQQQHQQQQLVTYQDRPPPPPYNEYTQLNAAAESAALNLSSIGVGKSVEEDATVESSSTATTTTTTHELRMLRQANVAAAMAVVANVAANANVEPVNDTDCEP